MIFISSYKSFPMAFKLNSSISSQLVFYQVLFFIISLLINLISTQYCPPINPPPYGYLIRPCGTSVGDNCNIDCEIGFDIIGPSYRICRPNGTWSGTDTLCVRPSIHCPMLRISTSGLLVRGCQNFAGGVCNFQCTPNLILVGDRQIFCQTDGTWSASPPTCRSNSCPPPPAPPVYGGFSGGIGGCSNAIGSFCTYQCNPGYVLTGSPQIQCTQEGRWSGAPPSCQPMQRYTIPQPEPQRYSSCSPLYPPSNGSITGNCGPIIGVTEECRFACDSGFILDGSAVLICQPNGRWSAEPPKCRGNMCPSIATSSIYSSGQCNPGLPGQLCNFACPKGSMLLGSPQLLCQADGTWNTAVPSCRTPSCPSLAPPPNGQISGSCGPGRLGEQCNFFCAPGFNLVGSSKLRCESNGQWSAPSPTCIPSGCADLQVPLGGLFKSEASSCSGCPNTCPGRPGQVCTLLCGRGFRLSASGGQTVMCNPSTMRWEPEPPTCIRERYVP